MKNIIVLILFCGALQSQTSFSSKAKKLTGTFGVYHYRPIELNAETSSEICDLFIHNLDNKGIILKQTDINLISKNKTGLFEQVNSGSNEFLTTATSVFKSALNSVDSVLNLLSKKTLDFTEKDTAFFLTITNKTVYSPHIKYHAKRIERFIKSKSYDRVCNAEDFEKISEKEFNDRAREYSKTIIDNFRKNIKEQLTRVEKTCETALLNSIALRYDPHSNYFNQEQNQEFNKQLSSTVESFGLFFDEDDGGNIIVGFIEPGGAAWQSNEVNEGDIFVSMKMGANVFTSEGNSFADIQELLDKSAENKISLTLKKQNGQQKTIKLIKQKIASTENSVKGYILKKDKAKIGYISLPSFYTDMEDRYLPGCANDVAKEIVKLQNDSISGLIIDLRNNGGGSMQEAMNLAGIFIDEGPLFILKEKNKKPYLVKDINRGSLFKKPLVVMINETSASASELFSNIVKDYNIGLVVGQTSYGKGTAQSVIPLDTNVLANKMLAAANEDYIKVTNSKFYRLNCNTHQGNGVVPDVFLPASPGFLLFKENKEKFFLESDSIVKKVVYSPKPAINAEPLRNSSAARIKNSEDFNRYIQSADSVSAILLNTQKVALKFQDYKNHKIRTNALFSSFEHAGESRKPEIECVNNTFDKKLSEVNEMTKEFNSRILESIKKDIFISESFYIINDLIRQQNQ